jgi:hypothetical protein
MFGMPQAAPKPDWADMYFYQKLGHVIDTGADFVFSKMNWWLPTVGVSMVASLFLFSQGDLIPQLSMLAMPVLLPHPAAPAFGQRMPQGGPDGEEGGEDESEEAVELED